MTILDRIINLVADQYGHDYLPIKANTNLFDDVNGDELDRVELAYRIEDAFGLDPFSDDEIERMNKVSDILAIINEKRETEAPAA